MLKAGQKVAFLHNNEWKIGRLALGGADITPDGLYFGIVTNKNEYIAHISELDIIEGKEIDTKYGGELYTKKRFIELVQNDIIDIDEIFWGTIDAFISDGKYVHACARQ